MDQTQAFGLQADADKHFKSIQAIFETESAAPKSTSRLMVFAARAVRKCRVTSA
jgi:hypothetical protein